MFGSQEVTLATGYFLTTLSLVLPSTASRGILPVSEHNRFFIITFVPWCVRPIFGFLASKFLLRTALTVVIAASALAWYVVTHSQGDPPTIPAYRVYVLALVGLTGLAATETALDGLALRKTQCPRRFQTLRLISKSLGTSAGALLVRWLPYRFCLLLVCVCPLICLIASWSVRQTGEQRRLLTPSDDNLNFRKVSAQFWPLFLFLFVLYSSPVQKHWPSDDTAFRLLDNLLSVAVPLLLFLPPKWCSALSVSALFGALTLWLSLWGSAPLTSVVTRLGQVAIALVGVETVEFNKRNFSGFWFSLITVFVSWGGLVSGLVGTLLIEETSLSVAHVACACCLAALCLLAFQGRLDRRSSKSSALPVAVPKAATR